jgi:hypothetical protein
MARMTDGRGWTSFARRACDVLGRVATEGTRKRRRRWWVLALGLALIVGWQWSFTSPNANINDDYRVTASMGRQYEADFFFMLYHLGVYPLESTVKARADTDEVARELLSGDPDTLLQESGLTFRSGDLGRVYLFYPDVWVHRDARAPHLHAANKLGFIVALCALFTSFWWCRRPVLGALLVALFGSNPFQLYVTYVEDNYFSLPMTAMLLVLAINLPLFGPEWRRSRALLVVPIATALALALFRTVRGEPTILIIPACIVWLTVPRLRWSGRALLVVLGLGMFFTTNATLDAALRHKVIAAREVVREHGGRPYAGPIVLHHEFWHPVWCGLGDFDMKYGFSWGDQTAYYRVRDEVERRTGRASALTPRHWRQAETWDNDPRYPKTFFEAAPDYHEIVRDMVLRRIRQDPAWYVDILKKRIVRIGEETTPLSLRVGSHGLSWTSTAFGGASLLVFGFCLFTRRAFYVKLGAFTLPLSFTSLVVYSGGHTTSYSCFHLVAAAAAAMLGVALVHRVTRAIV